MQIHFFLSRNFSYSKMLCNTTTIRSLRECHFYESNGSRSGLKFILACSLCTDLRPRIAFAKTAGRGEYNSENEEGRQSFRL